MTNESNAAVPDFLKAKRLPDGVGAWISEDGIVFLVSDFTRDGTATPWAFRSDYRTTGPVPEGAYRPVLSNAQLAAAFGEKDAEIKRLKAEVEAVRKVRCGNLERLQMVFVEGSPMFFDVPEPVVAYLRTLSHPPDSTRFVWLIERPTTPPSWLKDWECWTKDANEALRFDTQAEAEAFLTGKNQAKYVTDHRAFVSEHGFTASDYVAKLETLIADKDAEIKSFLQVREAAPDFHKPKRLPDKPGPWWYRDLPNGLWSIAEVIDSEIGLFDDSGCELPEGKYVKALDPSQLAAAFGEAIEGALNPRAIAAWLTKNRENVGSDAGLLKHVVYAVKDDTLILVHDEDDRARMLKQMVARIEDLERDKAANAQAVKAKDAEIERLTHVLNNPDPKTRAFNDLVDGWEKDAALAAAARELHKAQRDYKKLDVSIAELLEPCALVVDARMRIESAKATFDALIAAESPTKEPTE